MLSSFEFVPKKALSDLERIRKGLLGTKRLVRKQEKRKGKVKAVKTFT